MADKITIDRAVAAEMLEFLVNGNFVYPTKFYKALRAALDQPALAQQPAVPDGYKLVPVAMVEFVENIATPRSEPMNSLAASTNKESRRHWMTVIRQKAIDLLNAAPEAPAVQSDRDAQEAPFEEWWEKHGQFCRAGGGEYEKTFAWNAWCAAAQKEQP